jgi:hypothetical protein
MKGKYVRTSTNLIARLGGLAAVVGGLLWSAKSFYDRNDAPPWPTDLTDDLFFVVLLLFLAGLVGLYARLRGRLREWEAVSLLGFVAIISGLIASIVGQLTMVFEVGPSWWFGISWWMFVFGFFVASLGLVFFGNSVVQSRALPRWRGLPLVIGALGLVLILVGDPPNSDLGIYPSLAVWMLYGLGWAVLGYVLWSDRDEAVRRSTGEASTYPARPARRGSDPAARFAAQRFWR